MQPGGITGYVDVAQVTLYVFWAFFAGLVLYLHREDKREGYPLVADSNDRPENSGTHGFPPEPPPKMFRHITGGVSFAPQTVPPDGPINAVPANLFPGAPMIPVGDPMLAAVGPGSWVMRRDEPDMTLDGIPKMVPLRKAEHYDVDRRGMDPRGWEVVALDGIVPGRVVDLWIDEVEHKLRYLEVETAPAFGGRRVLLPEVFARFNRRFRRVTVRSITAAQFANVPALRDPDVITFREEDQVAAYYGGGLLYATPRRAEPWL